MSDTLRTIPIELLQRGKFQARRTFTAAELDDLAKSISEHGLVHPVTVRPIDSKRFEILAGERRWRACMRLGWKEIQAVVKVGVTDTQAAAIGIIENIQRENLPPIEQAEGLNRLCDEPFYMTHDQIAKAIGKSRSHVTNTLRLLECPKAVADLVNGGSLPASYAMLLLPLPPVQQCDLAARAAAGGWGRASLQRAIKEARSPITDKEWKHPDVKHLERELTETVGAQVKVEEGEPGKGSLIIGYDSLDHLDGILELLRTATARRRRGS